MRISATHRTIYRYSEPVCLEPHVFRLRPRDDGTERVMAHSLSIDPVPAGRSNSIDAFGNSVVETWFWEPVKELSVLSAFEVETLRENPFDFLLPVPRLLELPLRVPEGLQKVLAPYRNGVGAGPRGSFFRGTGRRIRKSAHAVSREPQSDPVPHLQGRGAARRPGASGRGNACPARGILPRSGGSVLRRGESGWCSGALRERVRSRVRIRAPRLYACVGRSVHSGRRLARLRSGAREPPSAPRTFPWRRRWIRPTRARSQEPIAAAPLPPWNFSCRCR